MWDWILVYLVVFFFVWLFQHMVTFFDPPVKKSPNVRNTTNQGLDKKQEE